MSNHRPPFNKSELAAEADTGDYKPAHWFDALPDATWIREAQLVRSCRRPGAATLLPFSPPTLWRKVKAGTFPKPTKLSERVTAWKVGDVRAWLSAQVLASGGGTHTVNKMPTASPSYTAGTTEIGIVPEASYPHGGCTDPCCHLAGLSDGHCIRPAKSLAALGAMVTLNPSGRRTAALAGKRTASKRVLGVGA